MSKPLHAPAAASLLKAARDARALFDRMGPINEEKGELSKEVVDTLHQAGHFGMFVPKGLGGSEIRPTEALDILEEVAYADGSTGWVLMASILSIGTAGSYLDEADVQRIFSLDRMPMIAGHGAPMGKARRVPGGFIISGNWSYGSGVKHADFLHSGGMVCNDDGSPVIGANGLPETRVFVIPREACVLGDNWDVMGLRATGSIDYTCKDVFIPEGATHLTECTTPKRGGPLFTLGIRGMSTIGHTGFTLGVGRRMLDELAALAQVKKGRFGLLGDGESFLENFGAAEAKLRAAKAFAYETWRDIEQSLYRGEPLSTRQGTMHRLSLNHVTWTIAEVSRFAYYAAAGNSLRASALQRFFRDMHGATQHATSSAPILRDCGRELAGVTPDKVWGFSTLMNAPQSEKK
ncbi:MAG: acyl-CoA dehydrogenase [Betaproteobacteria bacterium]|nr:acyl-CoA dehydrogenase [Betaproteobacteria bacterium]